MAYVSQKQLGGILNFTDIDLSETIGIGTDIAQARAINFNQVTPDIVVTLAAPSPPVAKPFHIVNRGSVSITVEGVVVNPGPAYGLYWDGTAYTPVQVEGVGTISNKVATETAILQGDGSPIAPLGVNVRVSTAAGNGVVINTDGIYVEQSRMDSSTFRAVDATNGNDLFTGDLFAPFKTIAKALENPVSGMLVTLMPGTYTEDVILPAGVTIEGFVGDSKATINGQITHVAGALNSSIRNVILAGKTTVPTIDLNGATTGLSLVNVDLRTPDGLTGIALRFVGSNNGIFTLKNTAISGAITIANNSNIIDLTIEGGTGTPDITISDAQASVKVVNRFSIGTITHSSGKLILSGVGYVKANVDTDSLISTATAATSSLLIVENVGFLQPDGSFGDLLKTGDCSYAFGSIHLQSTNDTFTGTRIFVDNAGNIHAGYTPTAYTPTNESLVGHLAGINAALQAAAGGLSAVEHSDSGTVTITGAGTVASPLTADVNVSSAANNAVTTNPDGIYVPVANVGLETVAHANSDTLDLTGSGTAGDPLIGTVSISTTPNNLLTSDAGGLLVAKQQEYADIIFNASYNWLDNDRLMSLVATRDFTLPQGLAGSQIIMTTLAGEDVASVVTISKIVAGVSENIGTITFNYVYATDNTPGPPTFLAAVTISFINEVVFNVGNTLVFTTDVAARFDNVSIDLLALRPL